MARYILLVAALAAFLQTTTYSQDADVDGAAALGHFVGSWQAEVTNKPAKWTPDGAKHTDSEHTIRVLKNRFILTHTIRQPEGVKGMWLMGYEPASKSYPFWMFDSNGLFGAEWRGTWDESSKTLTLHTTDTPKGWTSQGTNHFPDKKSNHIEYWIKDETGTLLLHGGGTKIRQTEEAGKRTLAAWSKTDKADDPLSPEMKVLERLIGSWDTTAVSKPAEWMPKEVRTTGSITRVWALNRSIVLENANSSDETEGMHLFTYDPQQKAFRSWWFGSEGHTSKSTGQWDDVSETISMRSDLGNGMISRSVIRFIDKDNHDARVVITDGDGKLYFDKKWVVKRSKK